MSFSDLGLLPELLRAVADKGYDTPSPIQIQAIPAVLAGRDVLAGAQTGTGKTAGFVLPILQRTEFSALQLTTCYFIDVFMSNPFASRAAWASASPWAIQREMFSLRQVAPSRNLPR